MTNDLDAALGIARAAAIGLAIWLAVFVIWTYWL